MKKILFSAISLFEGGPLKIVYNILDEIEANSLFERYEFIFLVYKKELYEDYAHLFDKIEFREFRDARDGVINKYFYELFRFKALSKELDVDLWVTLTSKSPNIVAKKQVIYFSNPTPFAKIRAVDYKYGLGYVLFAMFYKHIIKINIGRNDYIITQQNWLREAISRKYKFSRERIIVSYANQVDNSVIPTSAVRGEGGVKTFFFPAVARQFKNFEVICQATEMLVARGVDNFNVKLTIDGSESKYSKIVVDRFRALKQIDFCGIIEFAKMQEEYQRTDSLIFPSYLETWGLPISEFKGYGKPMLIADLPYAYETASGANSVEFFNPSDAEALSYAMERLIGGDFSRLAPVERVEIQEPKAEGWSQLFDKLVN